jgi:hypothetical protein
MKWFRLICLAASASLLVGSGASADRAATSPDDGGIAPKIPPVLRASEPPDSGQITLPGPAPVTPAVKKVEVPPPVAKPASLPAKLAEDATTHPTVPVPLTPPPAAPATVPKAAPQTAALTKPMTVPLAAPAIAPAPAAATTPAKSPAATEIGRELAAYCQKQIGHWKESDARKLLGEPKRRRPAYDEKKAVNGIIYAFTDPTNKYKEVELDFDVKSGLLRTVFAYPPRLTWQECQHLWTGPVAAADAAQGRKFYSYTNRRLDVLVDPTGNVISLGWY